MHIYEEIPEALKKVIKQKNRARRRARQFPSNANKKRATEIVAAVRRRLRDYVNERWDRKLEEIDDNQTGLWNL